VGDVVKVHAAAVGFDDDAALVGEVKGVAAKARVVGAAGEYGNESDEKGGKREQTTEDHSEKADQAKPTGYLKRGPRGRSRLRTTIANGFVLW
jgi:hypothetical protein